MAWEMMDEKQALQSCTVAAYEGDVFCESTREGLDALLRVWVNHLKELNPGQLMIATMREASIDVAKMELLQDAQNCKDPCLAVPLLPDHWLVIARRDVLEQVGRDEMVRVAHENALQHARREGRPFHADTLRDYEQRRLQDVQV